MKKGLILFITAIVLFLTITGVVWATRNSGKTTNQVTSENAEETLKRLIKKVDVQEVEAKKSPIMEDDMEIQDELPDIGEYPLIVVGKGDINIEIFSSPEKAGDNTDGWLNKVAENFNKEKYTQDGNVISVSVRKIDSGTALEYIYSGKYVPDAYSPSNALWGEMLKAKKVALTEKSERLVGNNAGILLKKDAYDKIVKKYGAVNLKSVIEATINEEITMGYTNPLASSSGLNFILSALCSFSPNDIFADEAVEGFLAFQNNIPLMAQTTMQLREAALKGTLDGLILEYQSYQNLPELKNFMFTPYGVRHDEPLYSLTEDSSKNQVIDKFVEFCHNEKSQKLATDYGFNGNDNYVSELPKFSGEEIIQAQALWKDKKDVGKEIVAVFVADISGSMEGEPINSLKASLINASKYINEENSIGLVSYNSTVYKNLPIGKFDLNQRSYFKGAVEYLEPTGGTASFNAITVALDMLLEEKRKNPDVKLMLFLLSDGDTNSGLSLNKIKPVIEGVQIPIYTIGYNANIPALSEISSINEAASIDASSENVVYKLKELFNAQM